MLPICGTQSVLIGIPTQSVGTIHAERGNDTIDYFILRLYGNLSVKFSGIA